MADQVQNLNEVDALLAEMAVEVMIEWGLGFAPNPARCEIAFQGMRELAESAATVLARSPYTKCLTQRPDAVTAGSDPEGATP